MNEKVFDIVAVVLRGWGGFGSASQASDLLRGTQQGRRFDFGCIFSRSASAMDGSRRQRDAIENRR